MVLVIIGLILALAGHPVVRLAEMPAPAVIAPKNDAGQFYNLLNTAATAN
jgi:hypothetical protein